MILGKLIPAGTGLERYRNIRVEPTAEAKAQAYSMVGYDSSTQTSVKFRVRRYPWRSSTSELR